MSVLIKGMEMPKSCEDCPMCHSNAEYDYAYCCVSSAETSGNKIPSDCPLIPVPKHGRLADADVLTELCRDMQGIEWNKHTAPYSWEYAYEDFENVILNAPTIIPPEETNKEATNDQNNS